MKKILVGFILLMVSNMSLYAINIKVGAEVENDPYSQMTPANLNTMNSYIIPDVGELIDTEQYPQVKYSLQRDPSSWWGYSLQKDVGVGYKHIHFVSTYIGVVVMILIFVLFWFFGVKRQQTNFGQTLRLLFDGVWETFDELLGDKVSYAIKMYVVTLFFVVLVSNVLGVFADVLRFIFPQMLRFMTVPTAEFETTLALALISTIVPLVLQIQKNGFFSFLHEYVPVTGKGLMEGNTLGAKLGDIGISLFVGLLDIVGLISKVISLSMRLLGNMSSGGILLNVVFLGLGGLFVHYISTNLVIGIPIILYIQGLLVAVVQAFVFAMLTSIGIKLVLED